MTVNFHEYIVWVYGTIDGHIAHGFLFATVEKKNYKNMSLFHMYYFNVNSIFMESF